MKDIIYFAGDITYSFFENEIEYIKRFFNIKAIIGYSKDELNAKKTLERHSLDSNLFFNIRLSFIDYVMAFFAPKPQSFYTELHNILFSKYFIQKSVYVFFYFSFARKSLNYLKKLYIDNEKLVLYSFWLSRGAYAMLYVSEKLFHKVVNSVSRVHGYDLYEERNFWGYLPFRNYFIKNIKLISFISNNGLNYFVNKYGIHKNFEVNYLGTFNVHNIHKEILEKREICLLSCSEVISVKRLDLIVGFLKKMDGIPLQWVHFGNGVLLKNIYRLAEKKLSGTSIRFNFMGNVDNNVILQEMKNIDADFFVNMSDFEGLPVSMMEALSFGIPIIARNVGGCKEIVNKNTGVFYEPENENSLYEIKKFIKIRTDSVLDYGILSDNCISFWKDNFSGEKNYESFFHRLN